VRARSDDPIVKAFFMHGAARTLLVAAGLDT